MGQGASRDRNQTWEVDAISDHQPKAGEHCSINVMQMSEDGSTLFTGGDDRVVRIWDITKAQPQCIGRLKGHTDAITQIAYVGMHVITGSADKTIRKWSILDVTCLYVYEGHSERIQRLISNSNFIISSSTDKTCRMWRMDAEDELLDGEADANIRTFTGHTGAVYAICFLPGEMITPSKSQTKTAENGEEEAGEDGEAQSELQEDDHELPHGIHSRDILITGSADGTARSWSPATGEQLKVFKGHRGAVMLMAVDSEGTMLYTAGVDHTVRQWNIQEGTSVNVMKGHESSVTALLLSGQLLFTGSADARGRCFTISNDFSDLTHTYGNHRDTVSCLRYNGGILFTGCTDSVARAFDAKSRRLLRVYVGHEAAVTCMQVARKRLYTGSDDGILRVWDADVQPDETSQVEVLDQTAKSAEDTGAGAAPVEVAVAE